MLIPELVRHGLQQLIELDVAAVLGADRQERSEDRLGYRNGNRPRLLATQVGDIALSISKLRAGSFLASILKPLRRVDQALYCPGETEPARATRNLAHPVPFSCSGAAGSDRPQASSPLANLPAAAPPEHCSGAHEPADPTVRRRRGAHHRHLAPGVG